MEQLLALLHELVRLFELVRQVGAVDHNVLHPFIARQAASSRNITVQVGNLVLDAVELVVQALEEIIYQDKGSKSLP